MRSTAVAQAPLSPQPSSAGDRVMRASQALLLLGLGLLLTTPCCWSPPLPPSSSWPSAFISSTYISSTIGFQSLTRALMNQLDTCGMGMQACCHRVRRCSESYADHGRLNKESFVETFKTQKRTWHDHDMATNELMCHLRDADRKNHHQQDATRNRI